MPEMLEQILTLLAENPERLDEELGRWFDQFDAQQQRAVAGARTGPGITAQRVVCRHFSTRWSDSSKGGQRESWRDISRSSERDPPMPVDELASTIIALSKAVALARQTRHSATLTSAKVIRILLGMPATTADEGLATSDPRRSGEARLRQLRLRAGRCRDRGGRRPQAMARRGPSRNDGLDGGARRRAGVAQRPVGRGAVGDRAGDELCPGDRSAGAGGRGAIAGGSRSMPRAATITRRSRRR